MKLTIKPYHPLNVELQGVKKISWLRVWFWPITNVCSSARLTFAVLALCVVFILMLKDVGPPYIAVLLLFLALHINWWFELLLNGAEYWFKVARFHKEGAVSLSEIQEIVEFTGLQKVNIDKEVVIYAQLSSAKHHLGLAWATEYGRWLLANEKNDLPAHGSGYCCYQLGVIVAQGVSPLDTKLILAHELSHLAQGVHLQHQCHAKTDSECYSPKHLLTSKYLEDESRPSLKGYSYLRATPLEWAFGEFEADVFALYTSTNLFNLHHDDVEACYMARYRKGQYHPLYFFSCVYYHQLLTVLPQGKGVSWSQFLEMAYDALPPEKLHKMVEIVYEIHENKDNLTSQALLEIFTKQCEKLKAPLQASA